MKIRDIEKIVEVTDELRNHIAQKEECDYAVLAEILSKDELCELSGRLENQERMEYIKGTLAAADKNQMSQRLRDSILEKQKVKHLKVIYLRAIGVAAAMITISMLLLYPEKHTSIKTQILEPILITTLGDSLSDDDAIRDYVAAENSIKKEQSYNQLIVPAGCTYTITLSDSTEVLLNSGSTLIFPDTFSETDRNVSLTGEAYFSVSKGKTPFIVTVNNMEVKVYGTKFNINARGSKLIQTILVEGAVGVRCHSNHNNEIKLKPNELCVYDVVTHQGDISEVDASDYLGWIQNTFLYNERALESVLIDFEAWYGVRFHLSEEISTRLMTLRMSRETKIEDMLSILEKTADVKFIQKSATEYEVE